MRWQRCAALLGGAVMCATTAKAAAQAPEPNPPDITTLRRTLAREIALAQSQGYVPYAAAHLKKAGEAPHREARRLRREGSADRAAEADREARRLLLRAKGALLDLKLPTWAYDARYYGPGETANLDPQRGVILAGDAGSTT